MGAGILRLRGGLWRLVAVSVVMVLVAGCMPKVRPMAGVMVDQSGLIVVVLAHCDYGDLSFAEIRRSRGGTGIEDDEVLWRARDPRLLKIPTQISASALDDKSRYYLLVEALGGRRRDYYEVFRKAELRAGQVLIRDRYRTTQWISRHRTNC